MQLDVTVRDLAQLDVGLVEIHCIIYAYLVEICDIMLRYYDDMHISTRLFSSRFLYNSNII